MEKTSNRLETELRLGLPGCDSENNGKKRTFSDINCLGGEADKDSTVVGWPPVCAYRTKNRLNVDTKMYVKVSMDGAPFLRKIDLGIHGGYSDLAVALQQLFGCSGIVEVLRDAENCEYVPIYEDKDGDWMLLVGDVPWEMFVESCKRLRIMKRLDAKGVARDLLKGLTNE